MYHFTYLCILRKRIWAVGFLAVIFAVFASAAFGAEVIEADQPRLVASHGGGALVEMAGTRVLIVKGEPYEMGYQHGVLLRGQVQELVRKVLFIARAASAGKFTDAVRNVMSPDAAEKIREYYDSSIEAAWERTRGFIPERYIEEMRGLADGAQVPVEDVQLASIFPELFHCSGFALFGEATKGGTLLHGRILDYMTDAGLQEYALLIVQKPAGCHAFVNVGYAGFIGSVTGMNERHVAFGEMGGRGVGEWDGVPMGFLMRMGMEQADTLDEAVAIFRESARTCEYFYVISDSKAASARGLACWPEKMDVVRPGETHERLPRPVEDAVLLSAGGRYDHLVDKVKAKYGEIGVEDALELMDRPVAMKSCLHRVLFEPAGLKLWVANAAMMDQPNYQACYQPWYEYDFGMLLKLSFPPMLKEQE